MTELVDTGVLYADHDRDASRHDEAATALESVYDGNYGLPYVSEYIYDEAITLMMRRANSFQAAKHLGQRLRGVDTYPSTYGMLDVSAAVFSDAVSVFEKYHDHRLSFTDATTIALSRRQSIDHVLSFDDDFDGIVDRLRPSET